MGSIQKQQELVTSDLGEHLGQISVSLGTEGPEFKSRQPDQNEGVIGASSLDREKCVEADSGNSRTLVDSCPSRQTGSGDFRVLGSDRKPQPIFSAMLYPLQ